MHYCYKIGIDKIDKFLKRLECKFTRDWVYRVIPTLRLDAMNAIMKAIEDTEI